MRLLDLLPHKLKEDGNAENLKKILSILQDEIDIDNSKSVDYSNLISIRDVSGEFLDLYGDMFYVYRNDGESDDDFKERIAKEVLLRKTPCTIPAIQNLINTFVTSGEIRVKENHLGRPANIILVGNTDSGTFDFIFQTVKYLVPAGVKLFVPVLILGTWQDVYDTATNHLWQDINTETYVW